MTRNWTPGQRAAIAARSRTLVAAAAGSGKTSVLTELVAQALAARELAPSEVCAVTFTERASQEMRGRIADRLQSMGERELVAELERARIGTIHSLCAAILRRHGAAVGVDPGVAQLDGPQHEWLLRGAIDHVLVQLAPDEDVHWLRARMGDERVATVLRGIYRCAALDDDTARLPPPEQAKAILDARSGNELVATGDVSRTLAAYAQLWRACSCRINARKQQVGAISFDDLERLAVDAVRIPAVRSALRATWTMVLVDEFQDTNARQYELLDAIGADRLFMVGDEWQSIYRFRGADVNVFRARRAEAEQEAGVLPMRENFRSVPRVLDVINHVFAHETLFADRYEPVLAGTAPGSDVTAPAVELLVTPESEVDESSFLDDRSGREREAARVAERIALLIEKDGVSPGQIAVLYAQGTGIDLYERAVRAWGVPVLRAASGGYYDQRDVRDVLALLAHVRNPADSYAAVSTLSGPLARLEWGHLHALRASAAEHGATISERMSADPHPAVQRVVQVAGQLRQLEQDGSLVELVARATSLPELEVGAALDRDGAARVANLRRLVELAASAQRIGVRDLAGYLEFVAVQRRDARVGEASIADEHTGAVRFMTIHASKGLEFPHVFVVEAASRDHGAARSTNEPSCDARGSMHLPIPARSGKLLPTSELAELRAADAALQAQERQRLWYVAMTRAEQRLYVSGRWSFTPTKAGKPRAMSGALSWLRDALELPDDLGGAEDRRLALGGLVRVDTSSPRAAPRPVWRDERPAERLATPLKLRSASHGDDLPALNPPPDPAALRLALEETANDDAREWQRLQGARIHDAVARLLDAARSGTPLGELLDPRHGPWLTDTVRQQLEPVAASEVFRELAALGARSEVPYISGSGAAMDSRAAPGARVAALLKSVDAGRFDALAVDADGTWWIVDWKSTLPATPEEAWNLHGAQLQRYLQAALAAGAPATRVTLVSLADPSVTHSWRRPTSPDHATGTPTQ